MKANFYSKIFVKLGTPLIWILCFFTSNLNAQNGSFDVRFTLKGYDCPNNKVIIQVQVKSGDMSHAFLLGDANFRFDYDPRIVNNPQISTQDNFSNQAPVVDDNYLAQNLNGSSVNTTLGTVSLNIIYSGGSSGAYIVDDEWVNVASLSFDIVDASRCLDFIWHNDSRFPITGMSEVILRGGGEYDQYEVAANGVFDNLNICVPVLCNSILAVDDINSTLKNTLVAGSLAVNDNSSNGTKSYSIISTTPTGAIILNTNGTYTYTPNTNFVGYDALTYRVCNSIGQCDTARLIIAVTDLPVAGINSTPVALTDIALTYQNITVTGNVLNNDFDPDRNTLTLNTTPVANTKNGVSSLSSNGAFTYIPNPSFIGRDTLRYSVCDNGSPTACAQALVIFIVSEDKNGASNDASIANDDAFVTNISAPTTGNLLLNDFDPNNNNMIIETTPVSGPAHGSLTINSNGTFSYTPTSGYYGSDYFSYKVCNNGTPSLCDTSTVYFTVYPEPNIAPSVAEIPQITASNTAANFCLNITDPNTNDTHTATLCGMNHGTATVSVNNVSHQLCVVYTPNSGFSGQDTVCVIVCDNGIPSKCDTIHVAITVSAGNVPPTANDDVVSTNEDTQLTGSVATNDTDTDNGVKTFTLVGSVSASEGTLVLNTNGTYTFTPALNFNGTVTVKYAVCDTSNLCDSANLVMTVNAVNDPLSINDVSVNIVDGQAVSQCLDIIDPDLNETYNLTICGNPIHGTLTTSVDNATKKVCFTYTPNSGFVGTDSLCFIVCDGNTPQLCDTVRITLNSSITSVPPTANDDVVSTNEDTQLTGSVATNDTDTDNGVKTFTLVGSVSASEGTLVLNTNGTYTFTPALNFNGTVTVKYAVCDTSNLCDSANLVMTVNAVNDPLSINDVSVNVVSGQAASQCLDIIDPDLNETYNLTICGNPTHGTLTTSVDNVTKKVCFTYTPNSGFVGTDSLCFIVCDGNTPQLCDTVRITLNVASSNVAPLAMNDIDITLSGTATSGNVLINDSDPNHQVLAVSTTPIIMPTNGGIVLNTNGTYTYTPNANFTGTETISYKVCNNGSPSLCDTANLVIEVRSLVNNGDQKPVINDDNIIAYNDASVTVNISANDFEPSNGTLGTTTIMATTGGTATLNPDGTITFTPSVNFTGTAVVKYQICNNNTPQLCDTASFTISVFAPIGNGINKSPIAIDDAVKTFKNTATSASVAINDIELDNGQTLSYTLVNAPTNGNIILNTNGIYTYTPNTDYIGSDYFTYSVCDNGTPSKCDTAVGHILILNIPCTSLDIKVILEGAYITATGKMKTTLNNRGLLPGQTPVGAFAVATPAGQPFNQAPWNYTGTESVTNYASTVVDWVLVSLRTDTVSANSTIFKTAALLHDDGHIQLLTPCFTLPVNSTLYVVVEHRNHLGVMSPASVSVLNNTLLADFTSANSFILNNPPSFGQKQVGNKWCMFAGDGKKDDAMSNYDINFTDSQLWKTRNGVFDRYDLGDFNLDADTNFQDQVLWKNNNGKYSGVPH